MELVTRNSQKVKTKTIHRHLRGVGNGKTNNTNRLGDESCEATSRVQPTASSCWRSGEMEGGGGGRQEYHSYQILHITSFTSSSTHRFCLKQSLILIM
jgi:hypothetical protein